MGRGSSDLFYVDIQYGPMLNVVAHSMNILDLIYIGVSRLLLEWW
jgi:hypothetical protein